MPQSQALAEHILEVFDLEREPDNLIAGQVAYVVGFLFQEDRVCLIRKNKPEWQRGRLNGVGGKIEEGETARQAMIREFEEETGTRFTDWRPFAVLAHHDAMVLMFAGEAPEDLEVSSPTSEQVAWVGTNQLHLLPVINNLHWLIPLAGSKNREVVMVADNAPLEAR